jgi:hypothetical protein
MRMQEPEKSVDTLIVLMKASLLKQEIYLLSYNMKRVQANKSIAVPMRDSTAVILMERSTTLRANDTEFLESSIDKEPHVGDKSTTSSSFDLQITYNTKLTKANYDNEAEEEASFTPKQQCLRQRWMFGYGIDTVATSSSDVDCVRTCCVGVDGDRCDDRVLSAGRESECASVTRALKMTACRETMTGGNRVMRSSLNGSLKVAMILLRRTISHQTFMESSSLE